MRDSIDPLTEMERTLSLDTESDNGECLIRGNWITTYSGTKYFPLDPRPSEVNIIDIAHSLSMTPRYRGHTIFPYSVAEHCVILSNLVPEHLRLKALLHDAGEYILSDFPRPLKHSPEFSFYIQVENLNELVIAQAFNLDSLTDPIIKQYDYEMLAVEAPQVFHKVNEDWTLPDTKLNAEVNFWSPQVAEHKFLKRFEELYENNN